MSDTEKSTESTATTTASPVEQSVTAKPQTVTSTVLSEVAEQLKNSAPAVQDQLKKVLVERELNKRVDILDKALTKLSELKRDVSKVKPDVETFNEDGTKVSALFSKAKLEERKKAQEALDKLTKLIEVALSPTPGDAFSKLSEQIK